MLVWGELIQFHGAFFRLVWIKPKLLLHGNASTDYSLWPLEKSDLSYIVKERLQEELRGWSKTLELMLIHRILMLLRLVWIKAQPCSLNSAASYTLWIRWSGFPRTDNPHCLCNHRQSPPLSRRSRCPRPPPRSRMSSCWLWCTRRCCVPCRRTRTCPAVAPWGWSACWRSPCGTHPSTSPPRTASCSGTDNPSWPSCRPGPFRTVCGPRCSPWCRCWCVAGTARWPA